MTPEEIRADAIERVARARYEQQGVPLAWAALPENARQRGRRWAAPLVDALGDLLTHAEVRRTCPTCGMPRLTGRTDAARVREHLAVLTERFSVKKVGDLIGVDHRTLYDLAAAKYPTIHRRTAAIVLATAPEDVHAAYAPQCDSAILDQLLEGRQPAVLPKDKPGYARALAEHGWTITQVARALAMSGTTAKAALADVPMSLEVTDGRSVA